MWIDISIGKSFCVFFSVESVSSVSTNSPEDRKSESPEEVSRMGGSSGGCGAKAFAAHIEADNIQLAC
jgi:hypothetical protein